MQLAMIYFARVAFCSLAIHEFRKWLSIKDIFSVQKLAFHFSSFWVKATDFISIIRQ